MSAKQLAVDVGQTGIRARWRGSDQIHEYNGVINNGTLATQLAQRLQPILTASCASRVDVYIGASGFDHEDLAHWRQAFKECGINKLVLTHDSVTNFLGALGDIPGAVVAAGTGVVTRGAGPAGSVRVDGWGYLLGNAGAASWIGRRAMEAAMRSYDGRAASTALLAQIEALFPDIERAYLSLAADPNRVQVFGQFAKTVSALAASDTTASEICREAGTELAWSATTALRRVGLAGTPAAVCAVGSVFQSAAVSEAFAIALKEFEPTAELRKADGNALDGADRLATLKTSSPLHNLVVEVCELHSKD